MIIHTKFEIDEVVYTINYNGIVKYPIKTILTNNGVISYDLLESKPIQFGDPDRTINRPEKECFKSISELTKYYEDNIKNK